MTQVVDTETLHVVFQLLARRRGGSAELALHTPFIIDVRRRPSWYKVVVVSRFLLCAVAAAMMDEEEGHPHREPCRPPQRCTDDSHPDSSTRNARAPPTRRRNRHHHEPTAAAWPDAPCSAGADRRGGLLAAALCTDDGALLATRGGAGAVCARSAEANAAEGGAVKDRVCTTVWGKGAGLVGKHRARCRRTVNTLVSDRVALAPLHAREVPRRGGLVCLQQSRETAERGTW